jgi:hypothetical protein
MILQRLKGAKRRLRVPGLHTATTAAWSLTKQADKRDDNEQLLVPGVVVWVCRTAHWAVQRRGSLSSLNQSLGSGPVAS